MAVYFDGVHLVASTLEELHEFAKSLGIHRCYFHGMRKGHPHYDVIGHNRKQLVRSQPSVQSCSARDIVRLFRSGHLAKRYQHPKGKQRELSFE